MLRSLLIRQNATHCIVAFCYTTGNVSVNVYVMCVCLCLPVCLIGGPQKNS